MGEISRCDGQRDHDFFPSPPRSRPRGNLIFTTPREDFRCAPPTMPRAEAHPKVINPVNRDAFSVQSLLAYPAEAFCVDFGVNMDEPIGAFEDLVLDDVYTLARGTAPQRLSLVAEAGGGFRVHRNTEIGTPGARLFLDCALTLMPEVGDSCEAIVIVEVDPEGMMAQAYVLSTSPLQAQTGYRLLHACRDEARQVLARMTCVSFTRGTRITMATGAQVAIEDLRPGDRILTRDSGAQPITWIGQSTARAVGAMAPILIREGALNNARDLLVSPDHRLMVYQRSDPLGLGSPELLVRARDLVNGESVVVQNGGFVDYFQLLFEQHHIIYAEGIAAESLLIDPVTRPVLPSDLLRKLRSDRPHGRREDHGVEVKGRLLDRPDAVQMLKRASLR